jgi:hypothetical protein
MSVPGSAVATHRVVCPIHAFHWVHRFHFAWVPAPTPANSAIASILDQPGADDGRAIAWRAVQRMTGRFVTEQLHENSRKKQNLFAMQLFTIAYETSSRYPYILQLFQTRQIF